MLIQVQYANGRYDIVKSWFLDWLIESGRIVTFRRSDGWAIIGRDAVRSVSEQGKSLSGSERRSPVEVPLLALAIKEFESINR